MPHGRSSLRTRLRGRNVHGENMATTDPQAPTLTRRTVLARALVLPLVGALPIAAGGCSKGPKCNETGGLSADDAKIRSEIAAYTEQSVDAKKHCADCLQFTSAGPDSCGTCKVVKGPINPAGSCKLFVAKT